MEIINLIFYQIMEITNNFVFLREKSFWAVGLILAIMVYLGIKSEGFNNA